MGEHRNGLCAVQLEEGRTHTRASEDALDKEATTTNVGAANYTHGRDQDDAEGLALISLLELRAYGIMWHHVIPKHEWRTRFGNLKGINTKENLVNLTVEQHVQVHQILHELNGNEFDKIAFQGLAGMITSEDAIRAVQSRPKSDEHKKKISQRLSGKKNALGVKRTKEQNEKRREWMRGNTNSLGRVWITNPLTKENKILKSGESIFEGWVLGRNIQWLKSLPSKNR